LKKQSLEMPVSVAMDMFGLMNQPNSGNWQVVYIVSRAGETLGAISASNR
jgi:hypothetical protein